MVRKEKRNRPSGQKCRLCSESPYYVSEPLLPSNGLTPRSDPCTGHDPVYRPRTVHDPSHSHPSIQFTSTFPSSAHCLLYLPRTPCSGVLALDVPLFTTRIDFGEGMFGNHRSGSGSCCCVWKEDWECIGELLWSTMGCSVESGNTWGGGSRGWTMLCFIVLCE
jgi:hypothetical protein